ncbi:MAG: hypothetical protein NZ930_02495 [Candidatus Bipolaricaulota bacterium]|nr:hypothetical protein [Candidatus Bipolaricaulota bacterium]MDW8030843.1 hypothetical protein [Candidatus Bipolaricaulota bacterium]
MRKSSWVKLGIAVGVACVLGLGWALAAPRVQDVQLEIPLYEGAQVKWEVHLTEQEMAKSLAEWAQELSVLKIAGYTIAGERALEVLNFYDQTLSGWRRILWTQPTESGGARVFARDQISIAQDVFRKLALALGKQVQVGSIQVVGMNRVQSLPNYLFIAVSKRYKATDLIVVTAQVIEDLDVPIFEGAELQWEVVLTKNDLLGHLARWFGNLMENPPLAMRMRIWEQPERPQDSLTQLMGWLGILGIELVSRLFTDFSELRVVGYGLDGDKALDVLRFYEQHFSEWIRNFWAKPEESGGVRVFSQGSAEGLRELALIMSQRSLEFREDLQRHQETTWVIVLHARR